MKVGTQWSLTRLDHVLREVQRPVRVRPDESYREIGVRSHGKGIFHKDPIRGQDLGEKSVYWIKPGDLVFNIVFAWERAVAVAGTSEEGFIGSHRFPTFAPTGAGVDLRFLMRFFSTEHGSFILEQNSPGAAGRNKTLNRRALMKEKILLPPLQLQRAIADFLDKKTAGIDALIAKKERLIELLQEKRQALITQAVTKGLDPNVPMKDSRVEWLGAIPAHWSCAPLYAHFDVQLGKMLDAKRDVGRSLYPYLRNANVSWDGVDTSDIKQMSLDDSDRKKYRLRAGDLLVCEGGANAQVVGKSAIWSGEIDECYYQKALHRIRPGSSKASSRFLWYALWCAWGRGLFAAEASPTTVLHLTAEKLRAHRFPFPPRGEQDLVVEYLDSSMNRLNNLTAATVASLQRLREYRQALITAAVTGKLDVSASADADGTMLATEARA